MATPYREEPTPTQPWPAVPPPRQKRSSWLLPVILVGAATLLCCAGSTGLLVARVLQPAAEPAGAGTGAVDSPAPEPEPPRETAPGDGDRTPGPAPGLAVPEVTGARLPDARSQLESAGFANVTIVDATGEGRLVLNENNWVVAEQAPAAGSRVERDTEITLSVRKPSDGRGTTELAPGVVPDVICMDLQAAQDALQAVGFYNLASVDGTGQGRRQLLDRNWVVVDQSPVAGTSHGAATRILLTAVKYGEPTGPSGCPS